MAETPRRVAAIIIVESLGISGQTRAHDQYIEVFQRHSAATISQIA